MGYITDLLKKYNKREHDEARRIYRIDHAKDLYHKHDLDEGFWDKVYDVTYKMLEEGITRFYLLDIDGNVIDSFDN